MYLLKNIKGSTTYYLVLDGEYIIGRKECDILLLNDQSISKKHARITKKDGKLILEDLGSKYKTLHKNNEVAPNSPIELNIGDEIKFGVFKNKYKVEKLDIITTGTQLSQAQKTNLSRNMKKLGGKVLDKWSNDCTHLTLTKITLTVKVLQAIIANVPLVVPTYWDKFVENISHNLPPPDIQEYNKPTVGEALLNNVSFEYNKKRDGLFKNKLFIFANSKLKKQMQDVIETLGGDCLSWDEKKITVAQAKKLSKEILIIQSPDESQSVDSMSELISYLNSQKKRTIPLQEVAMAIILCSCEKNCNSSYDRVQTVFTKTDNAPKETNPLVLETQSEMFTVTRNTPKIETGVSESIYGTPLVSNTQNLVCIENAPQSTQKIEIIDLDDVKDEPEEKDVGKRVAPDDKLGNVAKKQKLETEKKVSSFGAKTINPFSQSNSLSKTQKPSQSVTGATQSSKQSSKELIQNSKNPFVSAMKRKASAPSQEPEAKKQSQETIKKPNPFSKFLKPKNKPVEDEEILSSTTNDQSDKNQTIKPFDVSTIVTPKIEQPNFWYSKKSALMHSINNTKPKNDLDEEITSIINLFVKNARVEVKPMEISIRSRDTTDTSFCIYNNKKNFKKFVKVPPNRPQTTVIKLGSLVKSGAGDTSGISANMFNVSREEPKPTVKRFDFKPKVTCK